VTTLTNAELAAKALDRVRKSDILHNKGENIEFHIICHDRQTATTYALLAIYDRLGEILDELKVTNERGFS